MEFRDLKKQYQMLQIEMDAAITKAVRQAHYISGPQVQWLEQQLAEYVGVKHCLTCANGTDALTLALKVWDVGPGDAVFVPDFTFFSSGECPAAEGATCIFVDVQADTFNIDPEKLEQAIIAVKKDGQYTPRVVVAVDLFGQPADYDHIRSICEKYGLYLLEDGAQGFGGSIRDKKVCSFGDISTTSFFPAKPLGCYGDGGAIFTNNDNWANLLRSLAVHGKDGEDKYNNIRLGMNSRLDTLQAAVLGVKLKAFKEYELEAVNQAAMWYNDILGSSGLILPTVKEGYYSSWAQYTVRLPNDVDRTTLQARLRALEIPTMVYYTKPMHQQKAFAGMQSKEANCQVTRQLCQTVLSLPMGPYMQKKDVNMVADKIGQILNKNN